MTQTGAVWSEDRIEIATSQHRALAAAELRSCQKKVKWTSKVDRMYLPLESPARHPVSNEIRYWTALHYRNVLIQVHSHFDPFLSDSIRNTITMAETAPVIVDGSTSTSSTKASPRLSSGSMDQLVHLGSLSDDPPVIVGMGKSFYCGQ